MQAGRSRKEIRVRGGGWLKVAEGKREGGKREGQGSGRGRLEKLEGGIRSRGEEGGRVGGWVRG